MNIGIVIVVALVVFVATLLWRRRAARAALADVVSRPPPRRYSRGAKGDMERLVERGVFTEAELAVVRERALARAAAKRARRPMPPQRPSPGRAR